MLSSPVRMNRSIGEVQFSFMIVHVRLCFIRTDAVTDEGASKSGLQIQILVLCMIFVFRNLGMPHMRIQFRRARPRMYRSRCFASKYSCAAHLKIYKYYAPLHRSELKMFADFDNLLDQDVSKSFAKCKLINKKKESKVSPYIWYFILREIHVW